jgi:hypothetical protein
MSANVATDLARILAGLNDPEAVKKLTEAKTLLEKHFRLTGVEESEGLAQFLVEQIIKCGATTAQHLASLSYEEIERAYTQARTFKFKKPETSVVAPIFLNKDIARIFRAGLPAAPEAVGKKKAYTMTEEELVVAYTPGTTTPVSERLRDISRGKPFVIFNEGGGVMVTPTLDLLKELQKGHEARKAYQYGQQVYTPYPVGQMPPELADENPLYPGNPLRPDGTCDQTNRSWASVPLELRQFCRIAWGGKIATISDAHTMMDRVINSLTHPEDKRLSFLATYNAAGAAEYFAAKRMGTLPKLRLPLKSANVSGFTITGRKV